MRNYGTFNPQIWNQCRTEGCPSAGVTVANPSWDRPNVQCPSGYCIGPLWPEMWEWRGRIKSFDSSLIHCMTLSSAFMAHLRILFKGTGRSIVKAILVVVRWNQNQLKEISLYLNYTIIKPNLNYMDIEKKQKATWNRQKTNKLKIRVKFIDHLLWQWISNEHLWPRGRAKFSR